MSELQEGVETDLSFVIADLNNRVRTLESKYNLLGERLLVVNQNMIEEYKKLIRESKVTDDDVKEIKKEMFKVKDAMRNMIKEMEGFAKRDQIKVLEKYIDLWSPLHFVTRDEMYEIVKEEKNKIAKEAKRGKKSGR